MDDSTEELILQILLSLSLYDQLKSRLACLRLKDTVDARLSSFTHLNIIKSDCDKDHLSYAHENFLCKPFFYVEIDVESYKDILPQLHSFFGKYRSKLQVPIA